MSLTNPNKVVTEERLNEYHQTILPYLGGMPEFLANKFSKSDLYSTDEKMIGQWIDGKPLYHKTIVLTASDIPNKTTVLVSHDFPSNVSEVISIDAVVHALETVAGNTWTSLPRVQDNSTTANIGLDINAGSNCLTVKARGVDATAIYDKGYVTIRYTKTTDSAISIGSDTDYSTTEKIIGTWIDGKPLYQLTVTGNVVAPSSDGTDARSDIDLSAYNIKSVWNYKGVYVVTSGSTADLGITIDLPFVSLRSAKNTDYLAASVRFIPSSGTFRIYCNMTGVNGIVYCTIQYTKTTD